MNHIVKEVLFIGHISLKVTSIMIISSSTFVIFDSTRVALHESLSKIILIHSLDLSSAFGSF